MALARDARFDGELDELDRLRAPWACGFEHRRLGGAGIRRGIRGNGGAVPAAPPTLAELILADAPGLVQRLHLSPAPGTGLTAADCYSLISGGVETWIDLSGFARHYSQATSSKRFTYSETAINGLPGVTCDGGDVMASPSYDLSANNWIARIVLWVDSTGTAAVAAERSLDAAANAGGHHLTVNEVGATVRFLSRGTTNISAATSTAQDMSAPTVVTGTNDQTLTTNESRVRFNGVDATAGWAINNNATSGYGDHADYIGGRGTGPTAPITGAIAADLCLSGTGALDAGVLAQIASIEARLVAAWSIT